MKGVQYLSIAALYAVRYYVTKWLKLIYHKSQDGKHVFYIPLCVFCRHRSAHVLRDDKLPFYPYDIVDHPHRNLSKTRCYNN